jgi:hypothetical protein
VQTDEPSHGKRKGMNAWMLVFFFILLALTAFAGWRWYTMPDGDIEDAERQVFRRFAAGLAMFWLLAVAAYLMGR